MVKQHVVFFSEQGLSNRNYRRFGIENFLAKGFKVSYFDISQLIGRQEYLEFDKKNHNDAFRLVTFSTAKQALKEIANIEEGAFLILIAGLRGETLKFFRALSKKLIYWGQFLQPQPVTVPSVPRPLLIRILRGLQKPEKLIQHFFGSVPLSIFGIRKFNFVVCSGNVALKQPSRWIDDNTKKISAHAYDYDLKFSKPNASSLHFTKKFGVFIDQDLCFHPDFRKASGPRPFIPEVYYKSLKVFFDILERDLDIEVVIAAHPRSTYKSRTTDWFYGRRVFLGDTVDLVKNCEFAMFHMSTAVNFALLFGKPFCFITCNSIEKSEHFKFYTYAMADFFNKKPIYIEKIQAVEPNWVQHHKQSHQQFFDDYIKVPNTSDRPLWDIVADNFLSFKDTANSAH